MKKAMLSVVATMLVGALASPGEAGTFPNPESGRTMCPSLLLRDVKIEMARTWDEAGYTPADFPLSRAAGSRVEVGETRDFWTWDLSVMPPDQLLVPATCRAVGEYTYVFVADDEWGPYVDQADVDTFMAAFEDETPAGSWNPDQGIIENDVEVFGEIPDALDGDPRVYMLFFHIAGYMGTEFDGFFRAFDQYSDSYTWSMYGEHSNECEMLYLNSHIRPISDEYTLSVAAHELEHMIHWGYDEYEVSWVDESCAEAAMTVNGYYTDVGHVEYFLSHTGTKLTETEHVSYGACLLWGTYMLEQFQDLGVMGALVADPAHGEAGVDSTLAVIGAGATFETLFKEWVVANYLDDPTLRGGPYGYEFFDLPALTLKKTISTYPASYSGGLPSDAADYFLFTAAPGKTINLNFSSLYPERFVLRVIKRSTLNPSSVILEEYRPGPGEDTLFEIKGADVFDEIVLVVAANLGATYYELVAAVPPAPCGALLPGTPAPARGLPGLILFIAVPLAILGAGRAARAKRARSE